MRMCTKLVTLANQVNTKRNTLITDALEFLHRHDEEQPQIAPIVVEYKLWHTYLVEQLHLDIPKLFIVKLIG